MPADDAARQNRDELFPGAASTLYDTDPELVRYFRDFVSDEVLSHGNLDPRTRHMVLLGSAIATQAVTEYRLLADAALTAGVTPVEIKEVVYQAVAYAGMSKVLDFVHVTNELLRERGVALPLPGQSTTTPETRMAKGRATQAEIVGSAAVDAMYANAPDDEQHFQRYLTGNCFGDTVARAGLDLRTRELVTFAILVSLGGCEAQVAGHVRGNLHVGSDRGVLLDVLTQLLPYIGYPRTLNGLKVLDDVTAK